MENTTNNQADDFIKNEVLRSERWTFAGGILAIVIGYVGITFWLNAIRATTSTWFLWVLIVIQFLLYFSIFVICLGRSQTFGLKKSLSFIIFVALAVLGRVNDWEIIIIPLLVIIMLILSARNKNVSSERQYLLKNKGE